MDYFLGTPFNMANYGLLAHAVASVADLQPGMLHMTGGNCHLYSNHISQAKKQIRRVVRPMVQLKPVPKYHSIDEFNPDDFEMVTYDHAPAIKGKVAV